MNYAFVVQARLGSTRLPGKILKPFYGNQSILDLMVHKLSAISNIPVQQILLSMNLLKRRHLH